MHAAARTWPRLSVAAVSCCLVLSLATAACSGGRETGTGTGAEAEVEAAKAYCAAYADLRQAAASVQAIDAGTTVAEAKRAREDLASAVVKLKEEAASLTEVDTSGLERASAGAKAAIEGLPLDSRIGQAEQAIRSASAAVASEMATLGRVAHCA